jgi:hypothetical protein
MKLLIYFLFFAGVIVFGSLYFISPGVAASVNNVLMQSPCDTPIRYSIGTVDERFNLTKDDVLSYTQAAEQIWESPAGKQLFMFDPKAKLTVNLSYDRRQSLSSQINELTEKLKSEKSALQPKVQEYESRSRAFKQRMSKLNQDIAYWNEQGGAPPEEYDKLTNERNALEQEAQALNGLAKELNQSADNYNVQVGELNQTVGRFNKALKARPEEGLYDPNRNTITIYFHNSRDEFVHTLAHEMGHVLGIGHVSDEQAVMHAMTNEQIAATESDLIELQKACQKKPVVLLYAERMRTYIRELIGSRG